MSSKSIYFFVRNVLTVRPLRKYIQAKINHLWDRGAIDKFINLMKQESKKAKKPVVVHISYFDYYSPMQQRPNHMFNILADRGYPCIFCCYGDSYTNPRQNMHVIPNTWLKDILAGDFPKVFDVPFGYPYKDIPNFFKYINKKSLVIYELIDDFDLLIDPNIINQAKDMFCELIKRENTFVLASANKLYDIALKLGTPNDKLFLNKNAVNLNDFKNVDTKIPDAMQPVIAKHKPIVGYFGSLTDLWFDFDLLTQVVSKNPQIEFVLIGLIYEDRSKKKTAEHIETLSRFDNFTYIPPVHYSEIPVYAQYWDVATIPFKINDITLGTSPLKLFEYMAIGLPIVTTPMPECKLYESVLIAKDAVEFEKQIKAAIKAKNTKKCQDTLKREALENTWEMRVNDMEKIIQEHYKK